jgi:hypothetical protein
LTATIQQGSTILSFLFSPAGTIPMFPKYRHTPILDPERKRCPVCHQAVYSLADIHPQCAVKRAVALESSSKREAASKAGTGAPLAIMKEIGSGRGPGD